MRDGYLLTTMPTYPFNEYHLLFFLILLSGLLGFLSCISEFESNCCLCSYNCRCIMLGLFSFADLIINYAHFHLELKTTGFCGWEEQQGGYSETDEQQEEYVNNYLVKIVIWIVPRLLVCFANLYRCVHAWRTPGDYCFFFVGIIYALLALVNVLPSLLCLIDEY